MIVIILDFVFGSILEYAYFKQKNGRLYRITNTIENIESEVLIFGSSRAVQHYDPKVIQSKIDMSVYNAGLDGQSILFHQTILAAILTRYKPKLIVLDLFEYMDFREGTKPYERLSVLLPYYNKYPDVFNILEKRSYFERIKLFSRSYPYNSLALRIIEGNLSFFKSDKTENGFIPKAGYFQQPLNKEIKSDQIYDIEKVQYFYDFVNTCKQYDIPLYIVISPRYIDCDNCFYFSEKICKNVGVEIHDFSTSELFLSHIEYFQNESHLNVEGAKVYSELIGMKLNEFYKNH